MPVAGFSRHVLLPPEAGQGSISALKMRKSKLTAHSVQSPWSVRATGDGRRGAVGGANLMRGLLTNPEGSCAVRPKASSGYPPVVFTEQCHRPVEFRHSNPGAGSIAGKDLGRPLLRCPNLLLLGASAPWSQKRCKGTLEFGEISPQAASFHGSHSQPHHQSVSFSRPLVT